MTPNDRVFGGDAGYRPRVRSAYYERVYVHSRSYPQQCEHRRCAGASQGGITVVFGMKNAPRVMVGQKSLSNARKVSANKCALIFILHDFITGDCPVFLAVALGLSVFPMRCIY
jgi:hypothetical protein